MKLISTVVFFLLAAVASHAQQALVNPTSVTLTQPGTVTVIITGQLVGACEYGNTGRTTPPIHVSVGAVQVTYSSAIGTSMAELGVVTGITASSVATGTLDSGTYTVASDSTVPIQITVILWNESGNPQGISLSDIELTYSSASAIDQAAFQAFIASLVQQQLASLQAQITDHENRITALEGSGDEHSSEINQLQEELGTLQGNLAQLQNDYDSLDSRVTALEQQLANLSVTNGTNGADGKDGRNADDTLTYVGMGLGGAGVVGAIMNAIFDSKPDASPENK
jgi:prefoldin subunit 5